MAWAKTVDVGTSAQEVVIDGENGWLEVVNINGGGDLYFTLEPGLTAVAEDDDMIVVPAGVGNSVIEPIKNFRPETPTTVSIIASSASKAQLRGRSI